MASSSSFIIVLLVVAVIGWLATVHWIRTHERFSERIKRLLVLPAWFPWMGAALGVPVMRGDMLLGDLGKAIASFVVGLGVFLLTRREG